MQTGQRICTLSRAPSESHLRGTRRVTSGCAGMDRCRRQVCMALTRVLLIRRSLRGCVSGASVVGACRTISMEHRRAPSLRSRPRDGDLETQRALGGRNDTRLSIGGSRWSNERGQGDSARPRRARHTIFIRPPESSIVVVEVQTEALPDKHQQ